MHFRTYVAALLSAMLAFTPFLQAQQTSAPGGQAPASAPAPPKPAPEPPGILKVAPIQGEGAKNSISAGTATQPAVEVKDEAGNPVQGAEVVFELPAEGPGGAFFEWSKSQTARTDEKGIARATGMTPNSQAGRFTIKVTATKGNKTGSASIAQENVEPARPNHFISERSGMWKGFAILGGVAMTFVVVYLARRQ